MTAAVRRIAFGNGCRRECSVFSDTLQNRGTSLGGHLGADTAPHRVEHAGRLCSLQTGLLGYSLRFVQEPHSGSHWGGRTV